jgi:CRISPR associated protein cas1
LNADQPRHDNLAKDILEEFCARWADRLALSLINLQQIRLQDFLADLALKADMRKRLFQPLQEKIAHPFLNG